MSDRHSHPHSHEQYSIGQLASHLRAWHKDEDPPEVWEAHPHFSTRKAHENDAARIDVHPWAMDRFKDKNTEVVFAVMEGCLKADAILSYVLKNNLAASVYSFPSVTLGQCPELPVFAKKFLKDKTVIIVPDADWFQNPAVENQARIYQARLLTMGANIKKVHVAAPPLHTEKGVDDFLGIGKGLLNDLVCIDVEPPRHVERWVNHWDLTQSILIRESGNSYTRIRSDALRKIVNVLTSMAVFAGAKGEIAVTLSCMANAIGVRQQRVTEVIQSLVTMDAVWVDGILDTGPSFFGGGDDWVKRPSIHILPEELRATELPHRTLGDVLGASFFGGR